MPRTSTSWIKGQSGAPYLPPRTVQERRRAALPDPATLRAAMNEALGTAPFKPGIFEPLLTDVELARQLPALGPSDLAGSPFEASGGLLLLDRGDHWVSLVTLAGVKDAAALAQVAAQESGTTLLDLKQASEDLVAHQRERIVWGPPWVWIIGKSHFASGTGYGGTVTPSLTGN